jgi:hypothetical protein
MVDRKEYMKEYYEQNKNRMNETNRKLQTKTIHCNYCNKDVKYMSMSSHRKTAKHKYNESKLDKNDEFFEEKIKKVLRSLIDF